MQWCRYYNRGCHLVPFLNAEQHKFEYAPVVIKNNAFIRWNTVFAYQLLLGAILLWGGSIVLKDIPDNEIWAGNPAKYLKSR